MCLGGAGATGAAGATGTGGSCFFKLDIFCATEIFFCWTFGTIFPRDGDWGMFLLTGIFYYLLIRNK